MSAPEDREFEMLLAAHGNRELTEKEERRLRELAEKDAAKAAEVGELDDVLAAFAAERALMQSVAAPADPGEEADEAYQRMQRSAASAAEKLRSDTLHAKPTARVLDVPRRRRHLLWIVAAAAVVIAVLTFAFQGSGRPGLSTNVPDDKLAGSDVAKIRMSTELRVADPVFRWEASDGARTYDVVIEDADGTELFARPDELARSREWRLTEREVETLRAAKAPVILRIVGLDGAALAVGTTGDLVVTLIE